MQMMLGSGECIASENNTALLPDSQFTAKANRLVSRDLRCGPVSAVNSFVFSDGGSGTCWRTECTYGKCPEKENFK